ncbi:MAG: DUF445 family protein [Treponema sp.]|jgi:uncharacterized membrane protein YheB (UPF0754 family)|nr:DUF445 family protein [Treponema sp.]
MTKLLIIWLVPPIIGAIIGYVTNALAIKMLFRPLTEKRLFGMRMPFTPGILPKQRHELAQSIGRMVERELLTPEIVRQRLRREDVRSGVRHNIALFTENLLTAPLFRLFVKGSEAAGGVISGVLRGFSQSPAFETLFERLWDMLSEKSGEFGGKTLREIFGDERVEKIRKNMEGSLNTAIQNESAVIAGRASVTFYTMFPQITDLCVDFLNKKDVRRTLEEQGRIFLSGAIEKLGSVQRFFISLGKYDVTLSEKMPEIINDLISQLKHILENPNEQRKIAEFFADSAKQLLSDRANSERIAKTALDFVTTYADKPLKDVFPSFFSGESPEDFHHIKEMLFASIKKKLAGAETVEAANVAVSVKESSKSPEFLTTLLEEHQDWTLASVFLITPEKKEALDAFICEKLLTLVDEQIANILRSVNIRLLVAERVDELDMIQVEHIILDIMADQLKWINILGAILGAFIGIFQAAFSWFTRAL